MSSSSVRTTISLFNYIYLVRVSYRGRGTPGFPPPDNSPTYDVIKSLVYTIN